MPRWCVSLFFLAVLVQAVLFVHRGLGEVDLAVARHARLSGAPGAPAPQSAPELAYLALPPLAALVPESARVLLVTDDPYTVPYEIYFLPRPFFFLQRIDPAVREVWRLANPGLESQTARQLAVMEARGLTWTPERMAAELGTADYLVEFVHGVPLPDDGPELELVARRQFARLYRVVRR